MGNPYENLPEKAFWRLAVANKSFFDISDIWDPKFDLSPDENVVTYGSCFAQHIGNALRRRGFNWLVAEKPPTGLSETGCARFNYNIFSARTANIYTTTLLKQWTTWALGGQKPPEEVWEKDGRFYDPFRPNIEPDGFESISELRASRNEVIAAFRKSIESANYFVFTLGLTESWFNTKGNYEYPMCPGTVAGDFREDQHHFVNQPFKEILSALRESIKMMRGVNKRLKFILTVSPVPLTATRSGQHVITATMASKSTLRAVAHQMVTNSDVIDYFPSYEIINSPVFRGSFFEPNQRSVNPQGVNFVMDNFFRCLTDKFGNHEASERSFKGKEKNIKEVCEEELLDAFGK